MLLSAFIILSGISAQGQDAGFTYQGILKHDGFAAYGTYDFQFVLYQFDSGGVPLASPILRDGMTVSNGLFTVILDFGSVFNADSRWLQIGVKTNASPDPYTVLAPRQELTPVPHAVYAHNAARANLAPWSGLESIPGGFADGVDNDTTYSAGAGLMLSGTTFSLDALLTDARYWRLGGNNAVPGQFLGTTNNQPLELRAFHVRALRLEPAGGLPNVIGGSPLNAVTAGEVAATIGGGYRNLIGTNSSYATIAGGSNNVASGHGSFIGGGAANRAAGTNSVVSGGLLNSALETHGSVAGGFGNWALAQGAFTGGGQNNRAGGIWSSILGGTDNIADESGATVAGGQGNRAFGPRSAIAGGSNNLAGARDSFIGGGIGNTTASASSTIAGGEQNIVAGGHGFIGGGTNNAIQSAGTNATIAGGRANMASNIEATIGGGYFNHASGYISVIAGGELNVAAGQRSTVGGGAANYAKGNGSTVGGGSSNEAKGNGSTVPGGTANQANGELSFAVGFRARAEHDGSFVWADDQGFEFASTTNRQFAVRAANGLMIQSDKTALDLRGTGAVRVEGAGVGSSTPVFIHRATVANTAGHITTIDHPHCNGEPNAILIVTPNWNPGGVGGVYNTGVIGVYYAAGRWRIFNQDGVTAISVNAAFNVLVVKP